jgi:Flp pilus assembly protein TadG
MRSILSFFRDDRGSQSIAFILWVPIFVALLVIVIDAATLYITQTEMENVARDTARRMIQGLPPTLAKTYAYNAMSLRDFPYSVAATFDAVTGAVVTIVVQTETASIIGYLFPLSIIGTSLGASVSMRPDPTVDYSGSVGNNGNNGNNGN